MIVQLESCTSFPIARRSSTTRKAHRVFAFSCSLLHAGVQQKGFSLEAYIHTPCLAITHAGLPPLCLWLLLLCHDLQNWSSRTLHAFMMTDFVGKISCAQLEYASCAKKGCSCTKPLK